MSKTSINGTQIVAGNFFNKVLVSYCRLWWPFWKNWTARASAFLCNMLYTWAGINEKPVRRKWVSHLSLRWINLEPSRGFFPSPPPLSLSLSFLKFCSNCFPSIEKPASSGPVSFLFIFFFTLEKYPARPLCPVIDRPLFIFFPYELYYCGYLFMKANQCLYGCWWGMLPCNEQILFCFKPPEARQLFVWVLKPCSWIVIFDAFN